MLKLTPVDPCTVPEETQKHLKNMAVLGMPHEVCGLIYHDGTIKQYPNIHHRPIHAFDFDAPLDASIKYMWHSHPGGNERPSGDDIPCVRKLAELGFFFNHLIVTAKAVREYHPSLVDMEEVAEAIRSCP
jgi:proteasome lid subunit RPN8/RPN11